MLGPAGHPDRDTTAGDVCVSSPTTREAALPVVTSPLECSRPLPWSTVVLKDSGLHSRRDYHGRDARLPVFCDLTTEVECLDRHLVGTPQANALWALSIHPGDYIYLFGASGYLVAAGARSSPPQWK
jgi:hypothetical protein